MNPEAEPVDRRERMEYQLRRVGVILGWMLVAAGACYTLYLVRGPIRVVFNVLTPFLGAAVVAYILDPIVTALQRRLRLGRVWGLLICYSLVALAVATFALTVFPILRRQVVAAGVAIARVAPMLAYRAMGAAYLDEGDFLDGPAFVARLTAAADEPSRYLVARLAPDTLERLANPKADEAEWAARLGLVAADLNRVLREERLFERPEFDGVARSEETREMLAHDGAAAPERINRMLLEDAYPELIARSHLFDFARRFTTAEFRERVADWARRREVGLADLKGALPATYKTLDMFYGQAQSIVAGALSGARAMGDALTLALFILVISCYFVVDFDKFGYFLRVVIPNDREDRVFEILGKMDRAVGGFLRGQLIVCFCVGAMTTLGLALLGFHTPALARYCLLIGITAGAANFIPYLGPILGAAPSAAIVLLAPPEAGEALTLGYRLWGLAGVGALSAVIQVTEGLVLQPYVVGTNSELHPLVVMLALLSGAQFGLGGMIVAVPLAAMIRVAVKELWWDRLEAGQRAAGAPGRDERIRQGG